VLLAGHVHDGHPLGIRDGTMTFFEVRVHHANKIDISRCDEERNERPPYMSAEEPKSVSEVYIRVAVIDIDISAGITNICIRGGRRETLEAGALRNSLLRNTYHIKESYYEEQPESTSSRIDGKEEITVQVQTKKHL
jgi:hypothetical protein